MFEGELLEEHLQIEAGRDVLKIDVNGIVFSAHVSPPVCLLYTSFGAQESTMQELCVA